jgi:Peptidase A4 family
MRRHVAQTFSAAAAAGALIILSLGAAGAASAAATPGAAKAGLGITNTASGGAPITTTANCLRGGPLLRPASNAPAAPLCGLSGYQASGRNFRYARALITVPNHVGDDTVDPEMYVGLDASTPNGNDFARAGIETFDADSGWATFVEVQEPTLPDPYFVAEPVSPALEGDGILFSVYLNAAGNSVHFVTTLPDGTTTSNTVPVNGPVYTSAQALADWSDTDASPPVTTPAANTRVAQFLQGRFTTASGQRGTFEGPWTLNPVEVTSNGLAAPLGTLVSAPSYLWNDGNSLPGQGTDAFGVWLYS